MSKDENIGTRSAGTEEKEVIVSKLSDLVVGVWEKASDKFRTNADAEAKEAVVDAALTDLDSRLNSVSGDIEDKADLDHSHGFITNEGTINSEATIASGDHLVITDASELGKVNRSTLAFDGVSADKALTKAGTWETMLGSAAITNAINALDVSSVGGAGKYISQISETDGKISATATSFDSTPTSGSINAVTSSGIKTALDAKASKTLDDVTGILPVANGGTGQNSLANVTVGAATKATKDSDGNAINATYFKSSGNVTLVSNTATKIGTQNGTDVKLTIPTIPAAVSVKGNAESSYRTGQVNLTPANLGISATSTSVTVGSTTFNNTDTKVKATAKTDNVNYKILATASASPTSENATEAVYDTDITLNPSTNTIAANISGNAATATKAESLVYKYLSANGRDLTVYQVIGHSEMRGSAGRTTTLMISDGDIGRTQVTYIVTFLCRSSNSVTVTAIALQSISSGYFEFGYYIADGICYLVAQKSSWTSDARINVIDADPGFVLDPGPNTPMPTGYTKGTNLRNLAYEYSSDTTVIGNDSPASDCKTYFTNMPNGTTRTVYNDMGKEYTIVFSKAASGDYGSIIKYGYTDPYLYILRYKQRSWESSDWEKISAGTADSVSTAIGSGEIRLLGVGNNVAGNYQPKIHPNIRAYYGNDGNGHLLMIGPERGTGSENKGAVRLSSGTGYYGTLKPGNLTGDRSWNLPDETGNLAITSGNYPNMSVGFAAAAYPGSDLANVTAPDADTLVLQYQTSTSTATQFSNAVNAYNSHKKLYAKWAGTYTSETNTYTYEQLIPLSYVSYTNTGGTPQIVMFSFKDVYDSVTGGVANAGQIHTLHLDATHWTEASVMPYGATNASYAANAGNADKWGGKALSIGSVGGTGYISYL
jgi:hypothetical protein